MHNDEPSRDNLPAAQFVHTEAPAAEEYLPAAQFWHVVCIIAAVNLPAEHWLQYIVPYTAL